MSFKTHQIGCQQQLGFNEKFLNGKLGKGEFVALEHLRLQSNMFVLHFSVLSTEAAILDNVTLDVSPTEFNGDRSKTTQQMYINVKSNVTMCYDG